MIGETGGVVTHPTASGGGAGKTAAGREVDKTAVPGTSRFGLGLAEVESSSVADDTAGTVAFRAGVAGTGTGTFGTAGVAAAWRAAARTLLLCLSAGPRWRWPEIGEVVGAGWKLGEVGGGEVWRSAPGWPVQ